MKPFPLILSFLLICNLAFSQNLKKCDLEAVGKVNLSLEQLDRETMKRFLFTFSEECKNNIEFSVFGNEMLFESLQKNPSLFLSVLNEEANIFNIDEITKQLKSPIHDGFNLEEILKLVSGASPDSAIRTQIIAALKIAQDNSQ